jgi:drug/metabolite transporter (DMT)-like permease
MNDFFLFAINGGGWALKPILEKISVDKLGHYYFTFLRYFISGIIAIPFLLQHYYYNGFPKIYKNDAKLFFKDVVIWGTIVSVIAIAAIMANYYLLEKYDSAFVTPIAESVLLIFNAIFSVWILGEKFTTDMVIGVGFIIAGIIFIYREKLKLF